MNEPAPEAQLRAVVVDDTPDLRDLLCLALESSGEIVVVGEAGNGLEGVEQVRTTRPDIILLDLAMPVMDGLEALPHMRKLCPKATIVVLSGFGAAAMTKRALAAGANGYLQKGAGPTAILEYVRGLVGYSATGVRLLPAMPPLAQPEVVARLSTELSPVGVLALREDEWLTVVSVNPRAAALLGTPLVPGMTIGRVLPDLFRLVSTLRIEEAPGAQIGPRGRQVDLTVRRADGLAFVYVEPARAQDDGDLLRRAIATTAHEIRNPVTVLVGVADTLRERADTLTQEQRERLRGAVIRQASMLDSITADLLTAAQAHRGTLRVDLEPVDVAEVITAVLDGAQDVRVDLETRTRVLADPLRLEQMITNLVSNARKYGEPPYTISVRELGRRMLITVTDQGGGVPEEFRGQLFDEFTRASDTNARGTGLGLYVVRSLAEAQGGTVAYEPLERGGSSFTIRLPLAD